MVYGIIMLNKGWHNIIVFKTKTWKQQGIFNQKILATMYSFQVFGKKVVDNYCNYPTNKNAGCIANNIRP